jgi:hypothetical protein
MQYKVGDIIKVEGLGLMLLVEEVEPSLQRSRLFGFHGQGLFKMKRLLSKDDDGPLYILYQSTIDKGRVSLASDDSIIAGLTDVLCTFEVAPDTFLKFHDDTRSASISDEHNWIHLSESELKALREALSELN